MPFLNEKYEPVNTIISMNNTANPNDFDIIAICDAPEYEFEDDIKQFSNVIFVKNAYTIGVDACRSMGINMTKTPAVLIIDGHMRFSHDDWVNKIFDAVTSSPKTLWCTRSVVLWHEMTPEQMNPMLDVLDMATHYSVGANLRYFTPEKDTGPFGLSWSINSSFLKESGGYLSAVLGANYAGNTTWLKMINSFEGLMNWGFSEQYISIKNWLLGGDCRGLDTVSIGHIFRSKAPFIAPYRSHIYNILFTAHTLFPDELDIFENTIRLLKKHESNNYESASELLKTRWDIVCMYREKFQSMKKLSIKDFFERFSIKYTEVL